MAQLIRSKVAKAARLVRGLLHGRTRLWFDDWCDIMEIEIHTADQTSDRAW